MSIEIYDKAKVIKKDGTFYFFIKHGSKNSYTCGGQSVLDENFNLRFISRDVRNSDWTCIAKGKDQASILETCWNCPTFGVYGQIRFGNGKNIATYLAKTAPVAYEWLEGKQQGAVLSLILDLEKNLTEGKYLRWNIDLDAIKPEQEMKKEMSYCGSTFNLKDNLTYVLGRPAWNLDYL